MTVAVVLRSLPKNFERVSLLFDRSELREMAVRESVQYLDTLLAGIAGRMGVERRVLAGPAAEEIVREVSRQRHDLVIVRGAQWISHLPMWLRFDLAARLARRCHCAVRTVDPRIGKRPRRTHGFDWITAR